MRGPKRQIRYYASKGGYFTTIGGKDNLLAKGPDDYHPDPQKCGPTYRAAFERFGELLRLASAPTLKDGNTIGTVVSIFLGRASERKRNQYAPWLLPFLKHTSGGLTMSMTPCSGLTPRMVSDYIGVMKRPRWNHQQRRNTKWGKPSERVFLAKLHGCFNWATKPDLDGQRLLTVNPIRGLPLPAIMSKADEYLVSEDAHAKAIRAAKPQERDLLQVLHDTGCRPGELRIAEARHFDATLGAIVLRGAAHLEDGEESHKTSRTNRDRRIFLKAASLDIVRRLVTCHPSGALFRSTRGRPWRKRTICRLLMRIRRACNLPDSFRLYSYRHTFATTWLKDGRSIDDLATLLGNSPEIIRLHYSHLCDDHARLRRIVDGFEPTGRR